MTIFDALFSIVLAIACVILSISHVRFLKATRSRLAIATKVSFVVSWVIFTRTVIFGVIGQALWWIYAALAAVFVWRCVVRLPDVPWQPPKKTEKEQKTKAPCRTSR